MRWRLVVALSDAAKLLEPVEHTLDAIAILVSIDIAADWIFAI